MTDTTAFDKLREPFPPSSVGKLPKGTCRDCTKAPGKVCSQHSKARCNHCGNYMTTAHVDLDYVGHAEVTDRLLTADPTWTWEPVAWGADGLPALGYDSDHNPRTLWIRLTVGGVTRLGVGSVEPRTFDAEKQLIGDALRNAAMRFGVALDLWSKNDLESHVVDDTPEPKPADPDAWFADSGWSDKAEHDEARAELVETLRALPDDAKAAFKSWRIAAGIGDERAFGALTQDQWERATDAVAAIVDGVDPATGERLNAPGAAQPAEGATAHSEPPEGPETHQGAESAHPCDRCGSTRTNRVWVGTETRCVVVKDCNKRRADRLAGESNQEGEVK